MTEPIKLDMRRKTGKNVKFCFLTLKKKQSQIHGNSVADGWAGAVMGKPLGILLYTNESKIQEVNPPKTVAPPPTAATAE